MQLFKLMATLGLDDTEYKKKLADAEKKTEGMGKAVSGAAGVIKKAAIPMLVGAMGKSVIETGMSFEASMSQVAATMGMSADEIHKGSKEFELLKDAAKEAGSTTKFTATESAEALNYLALAGYDAETAVATLPTVLDLAAAGGMDLAYASDLVTDSMSALGLESNKTTEFADKLAKASQKSNTSVSQLGEAILTVGGTAKNLAGGVTEMNTVLGIFADAGIKGSEGGTALRNIILAMTPTTDKAVAAFEQLNLKTYDAQGNLRPLNEIFSEMNNKLKTMTQEERTEVLTKIFNKVDLKSANALLAKSGERFNELSGYIDDSNGAAETMAKTMSDNLDGALTTLGSALDGLKTEIFETFGESAKNLVNLFATGIQNITQAFKEGKLDNALRLIAAGLAGVMTYLTLMKGYAIATAVIGIAKSLFTAATMVKSFAGAWAILKTVMLSTMGPIGWIIMGISALVAVIVYLWNNTEWLKEAWNAAWQSIKGLWDWAWSGIKAGWEDMKQDIEALKQKLSEWADWWAQKWQGIKDFFAGIWDGIKFLWEDIKQGFIQLGQSISAFAQQWAQKWQAMLDKIGQVVGDIIAFFFTLPGKLWEAFTNCISKAGDWVKEMATKGKNAAKELFTNFMDGVKELPTEILKLGAKIPQMLWDGIKGAGAWLGNTVKGWVKGLFSFTGLFSLPDVQQMANFTATNSYAMAVANNARGLGNSNIGGLSQTTNVSLNIAGREFDQLVIKSVANNYGKIENIVQSKERGRR